MRPAKKVQSRRSKAEESNRFACLQTPDDGLLGKQSMVNLESPVGKPAVNRWKQGANRLIPIPEYEAHSIAEVDRNVPREIASVSQTIGQWERIPINIDSGAIDTVMPPHIATHFSLEHTKSGPGFKAANPRSSILENDQSVVSVTNIRC